MLLVGPSQLPLRCDALKPHPAHETGDAFAVDLAALSFEPLRHPGDAPRGVLCVPPVDELHETEIKVGDRDRLDSRSLTGKGSASAHCRVMGMTLWFMSMSLLSPGVKNPRLFFEPVHLHLELADLLQEFVPFLFLGPLIFGLL